MVKVIFIRCPLERAKMFFFSRARQPRRKGSLVFKLSRGRKRFRYLQQKHNTFLYRVFRSAMYLPNKIKQNYRLSEIYYTQTDH